MSLVTGHEASFEKDRSFHAPEPMSLPFKGQSSRVLSSTPSWHSSTGLDEVQSDLSIWFGAQALASPVSQPASSPLSDDPLLATHHPTRLGGAVREDPKSLLVRLARPVTPLAMRLRRSVVNSNRSGYSAGGSFHDTPLDANSRMEENASGCGQLDTGLHNGDKNSIATSGIHFEISKADGESSFYEPKSSPVSCALRCPKSPNSGTGGLPRGHVFYRHSSTGVRKRETGVSPSSPGSTATIVSGNSVRSTEGIFLGDGDSGDSARLQHRGSEELKAELYDLRDMHYHHNNEKGSRHASHRAEADYYSATYLNVEDEDYVDSEEEGPATQNNTSADVESDGQKRPCCLSGRGEVAAQDTESDPYKKIFREGNNANVPEQDESNQHDANLGSPPHYMQSEDVKETDSRNIWESPPPVSPRQRALLSSMVAGTSCKDQSSFNADEETDEEDYEDSWEKGSDEEDSEDIEERDGAFANKLIKCTPKNVNTPLAMQHKYRDVVVVSSLGRCRGNLPSSSHNSLPRRYAERPSVGRGWAAPARRAISALRTAPTKAPAMLPARDMLDAHPPQRLPALDLPEGPLQAKDGSSRESGGGNKKESVNNVANTAVQGKLDAGSDSLEGASGVNEVFLNNAPGSKKPVAAYVSHDAKSSDQNVVSSGENDVPILSSLGGTPISPHDRRLFDLMAAHARPTRLPTSSIFAKWRRMLPKKL